MNPSPIYWKVISPVGILTLGQINKDNEMSHSASFWVPSELLCVMGDDRVTVGSGQPAEEAEG